MREIHILMFLFVALFSCHSSKRVSADGQEASKDTVVVVVQEPSISKDSTVLYFEKTPCFGRCPAYKIQVYKSGFAVYEGRNFTEKLGKYSTHFSNQEINRIFLKAVEAKYFEMDSLYNNPQVTDLPSTLSAIHYNGMDQRVEARINIPKQLEDFHENLAVTLLEKDWQAYDER